MKQLNLQPLHSAIAQLDTLSDLSLDDEQWIHQATHILASLIAVDNWLPASHAQNHPQFYQQHALHIETHNRYSLSSFVWAPGQGTPIHDHTISGLVGVLRGAELCQRYSADGTQRVGAEHMLLPGQVDAVSPHQSQIGDVHTVRNAYDDRDSISIHLYRGDISKTPRHVYKDGQVKHFQSSYSAVPVLIP